MSPLFRFTSLIFTVNLALSFPLQAGPISICTSALRAVSSKLASFVLPEKIILKETNRIRDQGAMPGLYITPKDNSSNGDRVADLNLESIETYIEENPEILESHALFLVGVPIYDKSLSREVKSTLDEKGVTGRVRRIARPTNWFESIRYFFPLPDQDVQQITKGEVVYGATKMSLSGTVPIVVLYLTQPNEIALYMAAIVGGTNFIQSAIMTFPRQSWGNWQTRSRSKLERFNKQLIISGVFTAGLFWAAAYATDLAMRAGVVWDGMEKSIPFAAAATMAGWAGFALSKWGSALFQTSWRTPVHNGIYDWVDLMTHHGLNEPARRNASRLEMWASLITTQFFIYASVAGKDAALFHLLFDWNVGHIGMAVMGTLGAIAWWKPRLYNITIPVLDGVHTGVKWTLWRILRPDRTAIDLFRFMRNGGIKKSARWASRPDKRFAEFVDGIERMTRMFYDYYRLEAPPEARESDALD